MNNSWPKVRLGEVISHRKDFVRIDDLSTYKRCRVQLHAKGIVLRDLVTGNELKTKEQQICRSGDFLVAEIDAKVGGYGIVPDELDGAIVSSHYFLFEVDRTRLDRNFLGYFINTPDFFDQVSARGTTNYAAIRPSHVLEYQIPLPPLPEQQRIVAKIDQIAAKIAEANGLRSQSIAEVASVLDEALGHTFDELCRIFGRIPIGSIAEVKGGKRLPAGRRLNDETTPYPYIRVSDMKDHSVDMKQLKYVPEDLFPLISRYTINSKDVYVTIAGTIGYPGRITKELNGANLTENAAKLVFNSAVEIDQDFVIYMLRTPQVKDHFGSKKTIAAQPKLALHRISATELPIPTFIEQRRIVTHLNNLEGKANGLKELQVHTAAELDALLPSILDKAFKGEL